MDVRLKTKMMAGGIPHKYMNMIQIGTTACFTFNLNKSIIPVRHIDQLSFIFKQGDYIEEYKLYNDDSEGSVNEQFEYDKILNEIIFTMTPEQTKAFKPSYKTGLVDFEVVVVYGKGSKRYVFADDDSKIYILDSIYRKLPIEV